MIAGGAVFYYESWWVQIIKAIVIFAVIFGILPVLTVYERKLLGRFQGRFGPNRVGPYGLMQPLPDRAGAGDPHGRRRTGADPLGRRDDDLRHEGRPVRD